MMTTLRKHRRLLVILSLYLLIAVLYGATIPIFETPDAGGHYAYIHELTEGRGLPVQGAPSGKRVTGYVASHPPLYYALNAALTFWNTEDIDFHTWAWENPYVTMGDADRTVNKNFLIHTPAERFPWRGTSLTVHIARLVSTALGAMAIIATYGLVWDLFPPDRHTFHTWLAPGSAALVAFNPMFIFTCARVSNDAAVTAFGSLAIWGGVRLAVRGLSRRGLGLTGAALGLAALSKLSGVVLAAPLGLALLLDGMRTKRQTLRGAQYTWGNLVRNEQLRRLLINGLILFGIAILLCGWWFGRNALLYGQVMGVDAWLSHTATVRDEPIGFFEVIPQLKGLVMSFWALFGWLNVPVSPWMYRFWWAMMALAFVGLILVLLDQRTARQLPGQAQCGLFVLLAAFLSIFASVWRFIMIVLGSQGRYLMPAVAPIGVFLMLGLGRLAPRRWRRHLAETVGLLHIALALLSLFLYILPAYAKPKVVTERDLPEEMRRLDVIFEGSAVTLLGGVVETDEAQPGDLVPVSLYWQAEDQPEESYFTYIQILGRELEPVGGVDCYPGRGNFPPPLWQPGVIYRDRYLIPIASDMDLPTVAMLHAGLYQRGEEGRRRLSLKLDPDQPPLDLVILDAVPVRPDEPLSDEVDHSVEGHLGDIVTLVGYNLSSDIVYPGETLNVTLVWRAEAGVATDYTVFVHLFDENGDLIAQQDHPPVNGQYPTSYWLPGDVIRDHYQLTVDESASSGQGTLLVGMYHPDTKERLPAYDGMGTRFVNDTVVAGSVTIP